MPDPIISLRELKVYHVDLPQKTVFKSGIGLRKSKETLIVRWEDLDGRTGYGECACRPDPYYSAEFLKAVLIMMQKFIFPKLKKEQKLSDIYGILDQIRSWNFGKAAIEAAVFNIARNINPELDLHRQINSEQINLVPAGISTGIYEDKQAFKERIITSLEKGYKRLKFKISPAVNIQNFEFINPILFDSGVDISFDANGSYTNADLHKIKYFVDTYQVAIEQPTPPGSYDTLLNIKELYPNIKVCFDEEIKNYGDLLKLHQLGVLDEVNLKVGRVGGVRNSVKIIKYCLRNNIPCWLGGMFETGIGRKLNTEMASFLPRAIAHDLSPSERYFKEDIVSPEIKMTDGFINYSETIKCIAAIDLIKKYTKQEITLRP